MEKITVHWTQALNKEDHLTWQRRVLMKSKLTRLTKKRRRQNSCLLMYIYFFWFCYTVCTEQTLLKITDFYQLNKCNIKSINTEIILYLIPDKCIYTFSWKSRKKYFFLVRFSIGLLDLYLFACFVKVVVDFLQVELVKECLLFKTIPS